MTLLHAVLGQRMAGSDLLKSLSLNVLGLGLGLGPGSCGLWLLRPRLLRAPEPAPPGLPFELPFRAPPTMSTTHYCPFSFVLLLLSRKPTPPSGPSRGPRMGYSPASSLRPSKGASNPRLDPTRYSIMSAFRARTLAWRWHPRKAHPLESESALRSNLSCRRSSSDVFLSRTSSRRSALPKPPRLAARTCSATAASGATGIA